MQNLYLAEEWRRTHPDLTVYLPDMLGGNDAASQHFNVIALPNGAFLAFWTMSTFENSGGQRVVCSRSMDRGRAWSPPQVIDCPKPGDPDLNLVHLRPTVTVDQIQQ